MTAKERDAVSAAQEWLAKHGVPASAHRSSESGPRFGAHRPKADDGPRAYDDDSGFDGGDAVTAAEADVHHGLDAEVGAGPDADPEAVARSIVLRKLALRAHTRAELEKALKRKRVPDDTIEAVLDRMVEVHLVDDEVFARDWVESRQKRRFLSKSALRQELSRKGVEREEIDVAVSAVQPADELAAARALATKKAPALARLEPHVRHRRMAGMLARRGFSSAVVSRVLEDSLAPSDDDA